MKYIRILVAAVAAAPVALLLGLLGAGTASAETVNCPNVNTSVADADCKATADPDGIGGDVNVDDTAIVDKVSLKVAVGL